MTADCLRKMFNNEKRRIKSKANKGIYSQYKNVFEIMRI